MRNTHSQLHSLRTTRTAQLAAGAYSEKQLSRGSPMSYVIDSTSCEILLPPQSRCEPDQDEHAEGKRSCCRENRQRPRESLPQQAQASWERRSLPREPVSLGRTRHPVALAPCPLPLAPCRAVPCKPYYLHRKRSNENGKPKTNRRIYDREGSGIRCSPTRERPIIKRNNLL